MHKKLSEFSAKNRTNCMWDGNGLIFHKPDLKYIAQIGLDIFFWIMKKRVQIHDSLIMNEHVLMHMRKLHE